MNTDKVLEKIKKLLSLAENNSSIEEAANAAAQAQRLMLKHQITEEMLEDKKAQMIIDEAKAIYVGKSLIYWKFKLAEGLSKSFNAKVFHTYVKHEGIKESYISIIGTRADIDTMKYLYYYLIASIENLCKRDGKGKGKTWSNSYKLGATETVTKRIKKNKNENMEDIKSKILLEKGEATGLAVISKSLKIQEAVLRQVFETVNELNLDVQNKKLMLEKAPLNTGRAAGFEIDIETKKDKLLN